MRTQAIRERDQVAHILHASFRLREVLGETHGVDLGAVTAIDVDVDHLGLDVWSGESCWRFQAMGAKSVLTQDPHTGAEELRADPELARLIRQLAQSVREAH